MRKPELIKELAIRSGQDKKTVTATLDALIEVLAEVGSNQGSLTLSGFGSFKEKIRPGRKVRNPATGDAILIPEKRILTFKASKTLLL